MSRPEGRPCPTPGCNAEISPSQDICTGCAVRQAQADARDELAISAHGKSQVAELERLLGWHAAYVEHLPDHRE